jgi:hypothetical protein
MSDSPQGPTAMCPDLYQLINSLPSLLKRAGGLRRAERTEPPAAKMLDQFIFEQ